MEMYNLARNQTGRGENMTKGDFLKGLETDEELERESILFFFFKYMVDKSPSIVLYIAY